ncbi:MAG TPA: histidine--tRNA ligase [Bacteroidales bacterium]|nr:histidine--tRNA ligase [Bacteroidales bacterium]
MSGTRPSIPKGTRDFTPVEMGRRNYIFRNIKRVFENFGFLPIETPAMENLSTLLGKYGDEGDKLLFRILNSGDFLSNVSGDMIREGDSSTLSSAICDRGLRYDLTVPFARFVVQHRNEISFPFRRYQVQPVWRADRPQKGRYREFYQCDADVIGSDSLINEAELVQVIDDVFNALHIRVRIVLNNRKILAGIAGILGAGERLTDFTVALDKLDKMGKEKVLEELKNKGFTEEALEKLVPLIDFRGNNEERIRFFEDFLATSETGMKGVEEIKTVFELAGSLGIKNEVVFDTSLARGLNYYTGAIFEVKALDVEIGSICGGGRYDDLTGIFGMPGVSGVGISFGADRIYDVLLQLGAFPADTASAVKLLFVNFGDRESRYILPLLSKIRHAGINAELYPDAAKMKKQLTYANNNQVPFVALIGEEEISKDLITFKDMATGEQKAMDVNQLISFLS